MDRDMFVELSTVEQIINKDFFEELYATEPFACHAMLGIFKEFLLDTRFKPVERQLVLLRFLKNNYPLELSRDIIDAISGTYVEKDYTRIILEWNYHSSEFIKQNIVRGFDTPQLAFSRKEKALYDKHITINNKKIEVIQKVTNTLLDNILDEGIDEDE